MPVSLTSQVGDRDQLDTALSRRIMSEMRVATPGIIQSFNPDEMTCTVLPAIKGSDADDKGGRASADLPVLVDVPVVFPSAGGCIITFPVKEGDECLLVFADYCIDFWWQNGGVQEPVDDRQHDLSDAFAIIGPRSQARKLDNISTTAIEIRSEDNSTKISLNPASGAITGRAPGGFDLNGLKILPDGRLQLVGGSIVDGHDHGGVEFGGNRTNPLGG